MCKFFKSIGGVFGLLLFSSVVNAGAFEAKCTPFEWSVYPPVQLFSENSEITGLRLNTVYGSNSAITGMDTGVVGNTEKFNGLQVNLVNSSVMKMNGVQAGLCNMVGREDRLEIGKANGAQLGWVNVSNGDFSGAQVGVANLSDNAICGIQIGAINSSDDSNAAKRGNCFQLGVLNFNKSGFLPFFVLFNF